MKSQNMTKWMVLAALCVLGVNAGCESEKQLAEDFKIKCELSGGDYKKETNRCACSDESKVHPENIKGECADWLTCMKDNEKRTVCENCRFGTSKCENNELYFCNDKYEWQKDPNCVNSCVEKNYGSFKVSQCGICKNGEMQCNTAISDDSKLELEIVQKCVDGEWQLSEKCGQNSCSKPSAKNDEAQCGKCKNGDQQCIPANDGNRGIPQTCKNGEWVNDSDFCENNASCTIAEMTINDQKVKKSTCGVCKNESTKCENINEVGDNNGVGQTSVCKNGQYAPTLCQNGASCTPKKDADGNVIIGDEAENRECGDCKTGDTRCIPIKEGSSIGKPQTCVDGKWSDDSETCYNNASCTITKETRDDGIEVEKSICGICQNEVDVSCMYKSDERPARTGYLASCKNGEFVSKFEEKDKCPGSNSCKIYKDLTKCDSNSCECNSGAEKNTCAKGQYCKEELLEGAIHRKCVNAMSRCEENVCICGDVVCNRGEFCTVDENLNNVCVLANKCDESECTCGKSKCKNGEYCRDNASCADASEVITGTDWACGDCRNKDENNMVNVYACSADYGLSASCQIAALTSIDSNVTNSCIKSDDFFKCIEEIYHVACDIQSCKMKISDCQALLTSCYASYKDHLQAIKMCGFAYNINRPDGWSGNDKTNNVYYSIKQSNKCEQTSCACGSQSCSNGQFCFFNSECVDADKLGIAGVINIGDEKWFECQCSESGCSCPCGNQNCLNNQLCVGNTDATKQCKIYSTLNVTYVYKCQNDSCTVCDKDGKCIDTNNQLLVYDFVDSQGYVCRSLNGQCDAYMQEQKECLENSYSAYMSCLLECAAMESKETCQNNCNEQHAKQDSKCLKSTQDNLAPILKLGGSELGCTYSETTLQSCSYECQSGRIMPFNGFDACDGW